MPDSIDTTSPNVRQHWRHFLDRIATRLGKTTFEINEARQHERPLLRWMFHTIGTVMAPGEGVGTSNGVATVNGVMFAGMVGASDGVATVFGVPANIGNSAGVATVSGVSDVSGVVPILVSVGVTGMLQYLGELREDTAAQTRLLPQFVDTAGDPVTTLTINATDIRVSKNGVAFVDKNSGGATHRETGIYAVTFDATDASESGILYVRIDVTGALPLFGWYKVLPINLYDLNQSDSAALNLTEALETVVRITCGAGGSTTAIDASAIAPATTEDTQFEGRWGYFLNDTTTAELRGTKFKVTAFVHATQVFTIEAEDGAPLNHANVSGDKAILGG